MEEMSAIEVRFELALPRLIHVLKFFNDCRKWEHALDEGPGLIEREESIAGVHHPR